ncbi:SDR family oxidoreductase [Nesterenkonia marinintestina]|uniref:SDR family oxidoreductase n=1 Tax=Nesterenkonia marinintestina TaxID=2979865 RepID=UPI0021BFE40F|nr:SDR family oxidoreductase [Nesterenkonia sp. GX14115]
MGERLPLIGITGATGAVGGRVARRLDAEGHRLRLIVRDPSRLDPLPERAAEDGPPIEVRTASYSDTDAALEALRGVDVLFMVSAAESPDRLREHLTFIDAAADAQVPHMVYLSFTGASPRATFTFARTHFRTEEHLRNSGMAWTILRDNFYFALLEAMAGQDGIIRGPAGEGRVAAVSHSDVAASAAAVLRTPRDHVEQTYELAGPEALSLGQIARTLTASTGRRITYRRESVREAYASRGDYGVQQWQLDAWVSTYTAIAAGELERRSDVARLTGRPPMTFDQHLGI